MAAATFQINSSSQVEASANMEGQAVTVPGSPTRKGRKPELASSILSGGMLKRGMAFVVPTQNSKAGKPLPTNNENRSSSVSWLSTLAAIAAASLQGRKPAPTPTGSLRSVSGCTAPAVVCGGAIEGLGVTVEVAGGVVDVVDRVEVVGVADAVGRVVVVDWVVDVLVLVRVVDVAWVRGTPEGARISSVVDVVAILRVVVVCARVKGTESGACTGLFVVVCVDVLAGPTMKSAKGLPPALNVGARVLFAGAGMLFAGSGARSASSGAGDDPTDEPERKEWFPTAAAWSARTVADRAWLSGAGVGAGAPCDAQPTREAIKIKSSKSTAAASAAWTILTPPNERRISSRNCAGSDKKGGQSSWSSRGAVVDPCASFDCHSPSTSGKSRGVWGTTLGMRCTSPTAGCAAGALC
mmetsp:Transcript_125518/g.360853  ORF Transcript_125518/g.360853 Transcript_125518/m.360853 type:complete len:411 (+) Transcript_125518:1818-3050(+)